MHFHVNWLLLCMCLAVKICLFVGEKTAYKPAYYASPSKICLDVNHYYGLMH